MANRLSDRELLARLVAIDSTSDRSNLPVVDLICDLLDGPGVRFERRPSPDGTKANLIVEAGPEPGDGTGLSLSGHLDVVPAGQGWTSDPFCLTERGGRLYGRGSADMKGFVALATNAFARAAAGALRAPLALIFTYDEELGCLGAGHLADTWPTDRRLPRQTLIGEPTEMRVVTAHKGHLKLALEVDGVSAHSGYPHLGRNAIEPVARAVVALAELRRELEADRPTHSERFPEVPFVALNVARITGGTAINVVPARCRLELGLRLLPGMVAAPWLERVRETVAPHLDGIPWRLETLSETPALLTGEQTPLARWLLEASGQDRPDAVGYATDGGQLARLGLEPVVWGPGSITVAHKPDEFLPIDQMEQAAAILDDLITACCGAPPR